MAKDMYQKRKERQDNKKNETYDEKKTNINWYPGHMNKTKKQIKEIIKMIDVVIEVVDSRIPFSSHIEDLNSFIYETKVLLVFNKYDLCDKERTNIFIKYYEDKGMKVVTCDSKGTNDSKKVIIELEKIMKEVNLKRSNKGLLPKKTKVMVVGVPNVGKSTLINRLVGKKITNVANKPGVTKNISTVKINDKIDLFDTPGILWPKIEKEETALNLACMSTIREEVLPMDRVAIHVLRKLNNNYKDVLLREFGIEKYEDKDIEKMYEIISKKRGIAMPGNEVDYDRVSLFIINQLKSEKIKGITFDNLG